MRVVVGGLGEDVVHGVKRVLGYNGAQHPFRVGKMCAIVARVAVRAC